MTEVVPPPGPAGSLSRLGPERWRLQGADETWLPSLVFHGSVANPRETTLAVVREHPQHDGVLLSGTREELLAGADARVFIISPPLVLCDDI
jgi:hypothetical protein